MVNKDTRERVDAQGKRGHFTKIYSAAILFCSPGKIPEKHRPQVGQKNTGSRMETGTIFE